MPAYNFQYRFARDVMFGLKRQTIRAKRKNRPRVGQSAHCYTGMRTKACALLGRWVIREVHEVVVDRKGITVVGQSFPLTNRHLLDNFAMRDGFTNWPAMRDWFEETHGLPFPGDLIKW